MTYKLYDKGSSRIRGCSLFKITETIINTTTTREATKNCWPYQEALTKKKNNVFAISSHVLVLQLESKQTIWPE